jgi:hypothetical protein
MQLTVITTAYDMAREIPRTLQGLSRTYQHGARELNYEVLLVDNASPVPLDPDSWAHVDVPVRLIRLDEAPPSPVKGINLALSQARGDIVCLMIDGAHLLTPGVFRFALAAYAAYPDAVVATRYFWMGPAEQNLSITQGYDKSVEDELLRSIDWPNDGYRLFEVGVPLRAGPENLTWLNRMFESNCLFMKRSLFNSLGGVDERFDLPGGGVVNMDIFKRAVDAPGVTAVQLVGEGSFHQLHGGTTTNVSQEQRDASIAGFMDQYRAIRGTDDIITTNQFQFIGHLPTKASKIHRGGRFGAKRPESE